ncbi:glycosyltransferase family 61 protein [Paracoccus benzoatiresistens]|uniref:Glycosyltransferase 61 family protein n=1 Tax=Paracoccus benzoatiresistens TaxID=2997341 RepID=A0ABT4J027_9RHOB|nr:glycosyltransferase 61 family protein [Paracoccus sp. EF6]MCZ0960471.1 glycosyltransferase 61 family protein [Paracoccus sp. EF6]
MLENAIVAPPMVSRPRTPSGVWCNGDIAEAAMWRHDDRMSLALTEKPEPVDTLKGRYLFGGMFYKHFGHFITEAIGRLWANDNSYDGILMTPKHANLIKFKRWQRELLKILGVERVPLLVAQPTMVEKLTVPGQGFGLGSISEGTPEFKKLIRDTIGRLPANGPEKIYISRTKYFAQGGVLAESVLEQNLLKSGYHPIYAEKLGWLEQIAIYRSAKKIVSLDSSALHMVGLAGNPGIDIAVVVRRNNFEWDCMRRQLESFIGKPPVIINSLVAEHLVTGKKSNHQSWGVVDFAELRDRLAETGFIAADAPWDQPTPDLLIQEAAEAQRRDERPLVYTPVISRVSGWQPA